MKSAPGTAERAKSLIKTIKIDPTFLQMSATARMSIEMEESAWDRSQPKSSLK
jgi:hypothetical protein